MAKSVKGTIFISCFMQIAYCIDPKDDPRLPLIVMNNDQICYLNQVFWLVYDDATSWRSLSFYHRTKVEDIKEHKALAESEFAEIAESAFKLQASIRSGDKVSKNF